MPPIRHRRGTARLQPRYKLGLEAAQAHLEPKRRGDNMEHHPNDPLRVQLFTPGPLTTSPTVREALARDWGSRDPQFIALVREIRQVLPTLISHQPQQWAAVPMQGSGSFAVEAMLGTLVARDRTLLVLVNGAYGRRMVDMATRMGLRVETLQTHEDTPPDAALLAERLKANPQIGYVACVHCETTSGILNPIEQLGPVVRAAGALFLVDAMSSLGGIPLDAEQACVDAVVSSANKCIEGVPGFAFALVRTEVLQQCQNRCHSIVLDLHAQWQGLEKDGQFRFTPPTHTLAAFRQALRELDSEGGVAGRHARYRHNQQVLQAGMRELGFVAYLPEALQAPIITTYYLPGDPNFDFARFYEALAARGLYIYPGKLTQAPCFRIGAIGRLFASDFVQLLDAIRQILTELQVATPVAPPRL